MDAERLPRGADPTTHTKLGRGGLSDVEWTVQLLQLQHAFEVPGLRTTRTLPAITAAEQAGIIVKAGRQGVGPRVARGHQDPQCADAGARKAGGPDPRARSVN